MTRHWTRILMFSVCVGVLVAILSVGTIAVTEPVAVNSDQAINSGD